MQPNTASTGADASPLLWNATKELQEGFNGHRCSLPYLLGVAHNLQRTLEDTRQTYNNAIKQRDEARAKLIAAQNSLAAMERVVGQYATVKDPVVASDGFTYENVSICEYLSECASTNTKAYSQLTKEELLDVVVPNQTLRRLVHMLQLVRTSEVPPVSQRSPIPAFAPQQGDAAAKSGTNGLNWADEEADPGAAPLRVAELEATLVNAANAGSLNVSQSSVTAATAPTSNGAPTRRWENRQQQQQQQQQSGGYSSKSTGKKHPCLRVYGHCNFLDDCAFANYPYEACLNYIKGKCRFGQHCKEMHVNSTYPRYPGNRNNSGSQSQNQSQILNPNITNPTPQGEEKETSARSKRSSKEKESSKGSSLREETNGKELEEENQDVKPTPTTEVPEAELQQEAAVAAGEDA